MNIRAIVMDIDGTLATRGKRISPRTKAVLTRAQDLGIRLILASGRPTNGLLRFADMLDMPAHHGLLVSYNGARVTDCQSGNILFRQPLSVQETREILEHIKTFPKLRPMIDKGEFMYVPKSAGRFVPVNGKPYPIFFFESHGNGFRLRRTEDLVPLVDAPVDKVLTAASPTYLQAHWEEIAAPFQDSLSCMFTSAFYFEFTAKGVDKAKALGTVLPSLGINREDVIAFGDGQNDLSMLRYAGIGVAMENAVPQLKDAADEVTLSNSADGIAVSLLKHIPELNH